MTLPNFIIIGAHRSGTTALHYYLAQHPQVYMSDKKEPNYFAFEQGKANFMHPGNEGMWKNLCTHSTKTQADYARLFQGVSTETAIGEASPIYLSSAGAPERIKQALPEAKVIVILRDPVERAYSHFKQFTRTIPGGTDDSLQEMLQKEKVAGVSGPAEFFMAMGNYHSYLSKYFQVFGPEAIKVIRFEALEQQPAAVLKDVFEFLSVDTQFEPNVSVKYNSSGQAKNKLLDFLISRRNPLNLLAKDILPNSWVRQLSAIQNKIRNRNLEGQAPLSGAARRQLISSYYQDEIQGLQRLLNQDLSAWMK